MVRSIVIVLLVAQLLASRDLFDRKCVPCHRRMHAPLKQIFFDYLLYYSSERATKEAMAQRLLHPDRFKPIEGRRFKHRFREPTLKKALDIYWERYKVFGKIK